MSGYSQHKRCRVEIERRLARAEAGGHCGRNECRRSQVLDELIRTKPWRSEPQPKE